MSDFIINATTGHAHLNVPVSKLRQRHDGSITVRSEQLRLRIHPNDGFVCITDNFDSTYRTERFRLADKGIVSKISDPKSIPTEQLTPVELQKNAIRKTRRLPPLTFYNHIISFQEAKPFTKHAFLDDYSYSLLKVQKRFVKPVRHFSHVITEILETDYETFRKERIFVDRTVFGRLINALPYPNRLQFLLFCIEEFGEADLRKIHFARASEYLLKFVGKGVVELGKYITESAKLIKKHEAIFKTNKIGFQYEHDRIRDFNRASEEKHTPKIDYINTQAGKFNKLFSAEPDFDKLFTLDKKLEAAGDVEEFEKIFSKRPWPVDLNTSDL